MDKAEEQVNLAEQFMAEARNIVDQASKEDNLPEYILQPMRGLKDDLKYVIDRCRGRIDRIRGYIPADALVNEQKKLEYGPQRTFALE